MLVLENDACMNSLSTKTVSHYLIRETIDLLLKQHNIS
jgi:hypothetical protein